MIEARKRSATNFKELGVRVIWICAENEEERVQMPWRSIVTEIG
jgi:hypothetical protein